MRFDDADSAQLNGSDANACASHHNKLIPHEADIKGGQIEWIVTVTPEVVILKQLAAPSMVTERRLATFNLSFAILCGCAGFLLLGCFAPSGPDPFIAQMQELNARKTQAAADCN